MADPFCPRCGASQDPSNLFCPKCGTRLPGGEPEPAEPREPEVARAEKEGSTAADHRSLVDDELWSRLRAEEREYARRARRNTGIGCLVVLLLLAAFVAGVWYWGHPAQ